MKKLYIYNEVDGGSLDYICEIEDVDDNTYYSIYYANEYDNGGDNTPSATIYDDGNNAHIEKKIKGEIDYSRLHLYFMLFSLVLQHKVDGYIILEEVKNGN